MQPNLENLEGRLVPATVSMLDSRTMMVDARLDSTPVSIMAESNSVLVVNGSKFNTSRVLTLCVQGSSYNDVIVLSSVNQYRLVSNTHSGNDFVEGTNALNGDLVAAGNGDDTLYGNGGYDKLLGENGNDVIYGGKESDYLLGGDGNDRIYGDAGNDYIFGELGNDSLWGGDGTDMLVGGLGYDFISGGFGRELDLVWTENINDLNPKLSNNNFTDINLPQNKNDLVNGFRFNKAVNGVLTYDLKTEIGSSCFQAWWF